MNSEVWGRHLLIWVGGARFDELMVHMCSFSHGNSSTQLHREERWVRADLARLGELILLVCAAKNPCHHKQDHPRKLVWIFLQWLERRWEVIGVFMVGGPRTWKTIRGVGSKAMGGDRYVYGRWAIDVTSSPIASKITGIRILNRGVIILFSYFFFNKG